MNMGYEAALSRAWEELGAHDALRVRFLAQEYTVDPKARVVNSVSCNAPAKDFTAILILHYLAKRLKGLSALTGRWLNFRELSGVEGYLEAFRKRSVEPLIRKYGRTGSDEARVIEAFEGVPVLVKIWKADEDFAPDANIFFDASVKEIFCTEDIVVLAGIVASSL
jgi:hypothetical protein